MVPNSPDGDNSDEKSALKKHVVGARAILHMFQFTKIMFVGYLMVIFEVQDKHLAKIQRTHQKKQSLPYLVS